MTGAGPGYWNHRLSGLGEPSRAISLNLQPMLVSPPLSLTAPPISSHPEPSVSSKKDLQTILLLEESWVSPEIGTRGTQEAQSKLGGKYMRPLQGRKERSEGSC